MDMKINAKTAAKIRRNIESQNLDISLVTDKPAVKKLGQVKNSMIEGSNTCQYPLDRLKGNWGNWTATVGSLAEYFAKLAETVGADTPVVFNTNADQGCIIKDVEYGFAGYYRNVIVPEGSADELIESMSEWADDATDDGYDEEDVSAIRNSVLPVLYITIYGELD
jgi:hypothetical protein